jgi:butyryl-CoA dehydrogenase
MNRLLTVTKLLSSCKLHKALEISKRSITRMQSINFSDTHLMLRNTVKEFVDEEIIPKAARIDKLSEYPAEIVSKMGEMGLMGIDIDEKYDGAGMDYLAYAITLEEISRGCASCGVIMSAHNVFSLISHSNLIRHF